jgi:hypothetical protein
MRRIMCELAARQLTSSSPARKQLYTRLVTCEPASHRSLARRAIRHRAASSRKCRPAPPVTSCCASTFRMAGVAWAEGMMMEFDYTLKLPETNRPIQRPGFGRSKCAITRTL